jgi:hypothetical protein
MLEIFNLKIKNGPFFIIVANLISHFKNYSKYRLNMLFLSLAIVIERLMLLVFYCCCYDTFDQSMHSNGFSYLKLKIHMSKMQK